MNKTAILGVIAGALLACNDTQGRGSEWSNHLAATISASAGGFIESVPAGARSQQLAARASAHERAFSVGQKGRFEIGFTVLRYADPSRNPELGGRPLPVYVWYPVDPGTIGAATPEASYPLDVLYGSFPEASSSELEAYGADRAYQAAAPSRERPFPLVMFSPGWGLDASMYVVTGARLASHGFVVAMTSHPGDGVNPADTYDSTSRVMFNRPRDMSFVLTEILQENKASSSLLHHLIDPERIAATGHSIGGYTAMTLLAGDDDVCDASDWYETPEPDTCVASPPDPRFKVLAQLDGANQFMRFEEMARIRVPAIGINRAYSRLVVIGIPSFGARPHAAIQSNKNYRVDVEGSSHLAFSNICAIMHIYGQKALFPPDDIALFVSLYCPRPSQLPPESVLRVANEYLVGFLTAFLSKTSGKEMFTADWAIANEPGAVGFFTTEKHGNLHAGPGLDYVNPAWLDEFDYFDYMPVRD